MLLIKLCTSGPQGMELPNCLLRAHGGYSISVCLSDQLLVITPKSNPLVPFNGVTRILLQVNVVDQERPPV